MTRWSRPAILAMMALLLLSAGVNVLQAQRIRALVSTDPSVPSAIGRSATTITGFSMSGGSREVSLQTVPTVVYFFKPTCQWCEVNWPNVQALAVASAGRYRVLAVTAAHGLRDYVETHHLTVDVLEGISENTRQQFGFLGAPYTIVVSADGLITHAWPGAFTPRARRQIEDLFDVALPGLTPESGSGLARSR